MSRAAGLSVLVALGLLSACAGRPHGLNPSAPGMRAFAAESYLQMGDYPSARAVAGQQLEAARERNDRTAVLDAYLLLGEALVGMAEHSRAREYLVEVKRTGRGRQQEGARALLALSHDQQKDPAVARSYFLGVRRERVDPDLWNRVVRKLSRGVLGASRPGGTAGRRPTTPATILPRSTWAARSVRTHLANPMETIRKITVHHTAMVAGARSRSEVARTLRSIQKNHFERGWADIGYHYVIDASGRTWQCRPLKYQGAHAGNHQLNRGNIGISLMGNFNAQRVPAAQKKALARLLAHLAAKHEVPVRNIYGHAKVRATECPGKHLSAVLTGILAGLTPGPGTPVASGIENGRYHRVVRGDTLIDIARLHRVTLQTLITMNPGRGDTLHPGDIIALP